MARKNVIKVAICDDHQALRRGVKSSLTAGMECVLEAGTLAELTIQHSAAKPDVVILDLNLSEHPGATTVTYVLKKLPGANIIVYSMRDSLPTVFACYGAGAKGFVSKSSDINTLLDAIKTVAKGNTYFEPGRAEEMALFRIESGRAKPPGELLSESELDVLILAAKGMTNSEIAAALNVSVKTVRNRLSVITRKTGVEPYNFQNYVLEHGLYDE